MKCKVVTVVVHGYVNGTYTEYEFPELNKHLLEGYTVTNVHQTTPQAQNSHNVVLTFILKK